MSDEPFAPFMPQTNPPAMPQDTAPQDTAPQKGRKPRGKGEARSKEDLRDATQHPRSTRKPRTPKPGKPLPKYDLPTILKVAATLKDTDQPAFEKMLGDLSALPKASRDRVLAALQQVFG